MLSVAYKPYPLGKKKKKKKQVCIDLQPTDVLFFNTHAQHGNTEFENPITEDCSRLASVMYYRAKLGEPNCLGHYKRRKKENDQNKKVKIGTNTNLTNENKRVIFTPKKMDLAETLIGWSNAKNDEKLSEITNKLTSLDTVKWLNSVVGYHSYIDDDTDIRNSDMYLPQREYHTREPGKPSKSRAHGKKYSGGFSLNQIQDLEVDIQSKSKDVLHNKEIMILAFGNSLTNEWLTARTTWLGYVNKGFCSMSKQYKATYGTSASTFIETASYTWKNTGTMQAAFNQLCDVSCAMFEAKNGVDDMNDSKASDRSAWWLGFGVHLVRSLFHEFDVPLSFIPLRKLNIKLKDYEFGSTRYSKDFSEEYLTARKKRVDALKQMRTEGSHEYQSARDGVWIANDRFDYQTEDKKTDYEELSLPPPSQRYESTVPASTQSYRNTSVKSLKTLIWNQTVTPERVETTAPPSSISSLFLYQMGARLRYNEQYSRTPEGIVETCKRPTDASNSENYHVIVINSKLSTLSISTMEEELTKCYELLTVGGVLLIKDCNQRPFDHARLKKNYLNERIAAIKSLRQFECQLCSDTFTELHNPRDIQTIVQKVGFKYQTALCQLPGSVSNEFVLVFGK